MVSYLFTLSVSSLFTLISIVYRHRKIGIRAGVIGCRYRGDCGAGFMQVNSGSSCSKLLKDSIEYTIFLNRDFSFY